MSPEARAEDSAISPRLSGQYDIFGNGRLVVNASYGHYVGRLAEGAANDADPAGTARVPVSFRATPSIPGFESVLDRDGLESPPVKEFTFGLGTAIGTSCYARAGLVRRNWENFYNSYRDITTGRTQDRFGTILFRARLCGVT